MAERQWQSYVLQCFEGDEHCPVCRFIAGERTVECMVNVIERLDAALADEREKNRLLIEAMVAFRQKPV